MNAAFGRKMPAAGNLAFLSQSGALCTSVLDYAEERQMGFSKFISFGNKADVNEIDLLDYLAKDEKTSVIAMYLEDVSNGRRFIETVRDIFWKTHKPMLCLKSGRSPEGAKAVSSHTGSLAGSDSVYDAMLFQSGVQRVDTIAELFDYAAPLHHATAAARRPAGHHHQRRRAGHHGHRRRRAPRAEAGRAERGHQAEAQAGAARHRFAPQPDRRDRRRPRRPLQGRRARPCWKTTSVDMGIVILTPQSMTDVEETAAVVPEADCQGSTSRWSARSWAPRTWRPGVTILRKAGVPNYPFPEDGVKSLAAAHWLVSSQEIPRREMPVFTDLDVEGAGGSWPSCSTVTRALPDAGRVPARCWPAIGCRC